MQLEDWGTTWPWEDLTLPPTPRVQARGFLPSNWFQCSHLEPTLPLPSKQGCCLLTPRLRTPTGTGDSTEPGRSQVLTHRPGSGPPGPRCSRILKLKGPQTVQFPNIHRPCCSQALRSPRLRHAQSRAVLSPRMGSKPVPALALPGRRPRKGSSRCRHHGSPAGRWGLGSTNEPPQDPRTPAPGSLLGSCTHIQDALLARARG